MSSSNVPATRDGGQLAVQAPQVDAAILDTVIGTGDLNALAPRDRVNMYLALCDSVGLNPLSRPFEYIKLQGKTTLYFKATGAEQLRVIHGVNVKIVGREMLDDMYIVTATAELPNGRSDEAQGIVCMEGLRGKEKANALMRCETKAKRRVTLSILGMSFLEDVYAKPRGADKGIVVHVDGATGEITNQTSIDEKEERDDAPPADESDLRRRAVAQMAALRKAAAEQPVSSEAPPPQVKAKDWPKFIAAAAEEYGLTIGTIEKQLGDTDRFASYAEAKEVLEAFVNQAMQEEEAHDESYTRSKGEDNGDD